VRADLARARVLLRAGQTEAATTILDAVWPAVEALGDPAVRAETLLVRGEIADELGEGEAARTAYYEAVAWATRAQDRRTAAAAWIELVYCEGYVHGNEAAAEIAIRQSEAELAALGGDELLETRRLTRISPAYFSMGRLAEARTIAAQAALRHRAQGRDLDAAGVLMNIAHIDMLDLRLDDARATVDEVERIWTAELPKEHASHARVPEIRAHLAERAGDFEGALVLATKAYELRKAALGEAHVDTLTLLNSLTDLAVDTGDLERALELSAQMMQHGRSHENVATQLRAIGGRTSVLLAAGRAAEADALMVELGKIVEASLGPDSPRRIDFLRLRAEVASALARWDDAVADYERIVELEVAAWDDDHPNPTQTRLDIADTLRAAGRCADARPWLDRVTASLDAQADHPARVRLEILLDLATQLHGCGDVAAARVIATRATNLVGSAGLEHTEAAKLLAALPLGDAGVQ
jgi:tetratricopeptide (TPR) repeat protein